ncbi:SpaA isopeptide-forming pilin-related protein [Leucobacter triazinivorans]|uniref:Prealbumin-like fold domain-containing protein n=1 Tax=Leucobacter triazinivorans TaxID=1784719 RepID=A0A4P6KD61_9MICO|nr:SpaA isopeptide-forming pilin-related protein [Leucobacter triazinivorans]QBE47980.1 hypothetical protein EVS81_03350 [Leucobacter triazinivorans]
MSGTACDPDDDADWAADPAAVGAGPVPEELTWRAVATNMGNVVLSDVRVVTLTADAAPLEGVSFPSFGELAVGATAAATFTTPVQSVGRTVAVTASAVFEGDGPDGVPLADRFTDAAGTVGRLPSAEATAMYPVTENTDTENTDPDAESADPEGENTEAEAEAEDPEAGDPEAAGDDDPTHETGEPFLLEDGIGARTGPPGNSMIDLPVTLYAYAGAGENVDVTLQFRVPSTSPMAGEYAKVEILPPGGGSWTCTIPRNAAVNTACQRLDYTSAQAGVWTIKFTEHSGSYQDGFKWDITVQDASADQPGRVWTDTYFMFQQSTEDVSFWYVGPYGNRYRTDYTTYHGWSSQFRSNQFGVVKKGTCVSAHRSIDQSDADYSGYDPSCGVPYHIFFEPPSASLPAAATDHANKTHYVLPPLATPTIDDVSYASTAPASATPRAGAFTVRTRNYIGNATLQLDLNGNGVYGEAADGEQEFAIEGDTTVVPWAGTTAGGQPLPTTSSVNASVLLEGSGEVHFTLHDAESRYGITVTKLNGPEANDATLYWDDSALGSADRIPTCLPPVLKSGASGANSAVPGGVHGWACGDGYHVNGKAPWGDNRYIDDWAVTRFSASREVKLPAYSVTKSAVPGSGGILRAGETVTYTVEVENTTNAYLDPKQLAPTVIDDLTGVLDDASYNNDAQASLGGVPVTPMMGAVSFDAATGKLSWVTGAAPNWGPGQKLTITYSVTVTDRATLLGGTHNGDLMLRNQVTSHGCATAQACATEHPVDAEGDTVLQVDKQFVSATGWGAGDTITWQIDVRNGDDTKPAYQVQVADTPDTGLEPGNAVWQALPAGTTATGTTWKVGTLDPGETKTARVTTVIAQAAAPHGPTYRNAVTVSNPTNPYDTQRPLTDIEPNETVQEDADQADLAETRAPTATFHIDKVGESGDCPPPDTSCWVAMPGSDWRIYPVTGGNISPTPAAGVDITPIDGVAAGAGAPGTATQFLVTGLLPGEYALIEHTAPEGFSLLAAPLKLTVTTTGTVSFNTTDIADGTITIGEIDAGPAGKVPQVTVRDVPNLVFPVAGGAGSALVQWAAALLCAAGGALLIRTLTTRRRTLTHL